MSETFPNLPEAIDRWQFRTGRNLADLSRALGVSRATITRWHKHGAEPEVGKLRDIARVLGVGIAYLAADEFCAQTQDEIELLDKYRQSAYVGKRAILNTACAVSSASMNER